MIHKFAKINEAYSEFYNELLRKGQLPHWETPLGYWGYAIGKEVFDLFVKIDLKSKSSFLDLGSGDGKVVNIASLFTQSTGIEIDDQLIAKSEEIKARFSLGSIFIKGDFMQHDLSLYDILFIYPDKRINALEKKLRKELRGTLIVMGLHFHPLQLKKTDSFYIENTLVTIYENQ